MLECRATMKLLPDLLDKHSAEPGLRFRPWIYYHSAQYAEYRYCALRPYHDLLRLASLALASSPIVPFVSRFASRAAKVSMRMACACTMDVCRLMSAIV